MPRQSKLDPIRALVQQLGKQIGQELAAAITAHAAGSGVARGGGRGRPAGPGKPCKVPGCGRKADSKGLCTGHYLKGRRMKMNLDSLGSDDLKTLGMDLRSLRWKK